MKSAEFKIAAPALEEVTPQFRMSGLGRLRKFRELALSTHCGL